jgi:hypothetical protein
MPKQSFILNNNAVNYLIHGDLFSYKYEIPAAWFVIIRYERELTHNFERLKWWKKKYYLRKNKGVFETYTNAYSPKIEFYCFGLGFWKITKSFKVNFVNVKLPDLKIKVSPFKMENQFKVNHPLLHFKINKPIVSKTRFFNSTFSILNKDVNIINTNDYNKFKQEYKKYKN